MSVPSTVDKPMSNTLHSQGVSSTGISSCCPARKSSKNDAGASQRNQQLEVRTQQAWVRAMDALAGAIVGVVAVLTFVVTPWVLPVLFVPIALAIISNDLNSNIEHRRNNLQKGGFYEPSSGISFPVKRKLDETEPLPLVNPSVYCYANSMLQLLVTMENTDPEFRNKLKECKENFDTVEEDAQKCRLALHALEVREAYSEVSKKIKDISSNVEKEAAELDKAIKTTEEGQEELDLIKEDSNFPNEIFKLGRVKAVELIGNIRKTIPDSLVPLRNLCVAFQLESEIIRLQILQDKEKEDTRRLERQNMIDKATESLNKIYNGADFIKCIYDNKLPKAYRNIDGSTDFNKVLLNIGADFFKDYPFYGLFRAFELNDQLKISQKFVHSKNNKKEEDFNKLEKEKNKLYKELAGIVGNPLFDETLLKVDPRDLKMRSRYEQDPTVLIETLEKYQLAIADWRSGSLKAPAPEAVHLIKWLQKCEGALSRSDRIVQEDVYDPLRFILDMIGYKFEYRQITFEKDKDNGGFKPRVSSPRRNDETGMFDLDLEKDLLEGEEATKFQRIWDHFFEHTIVNDKFDTSKDLKALREIEQNLNAFVVRLKRFYRDEYGAQKKISDPIPLQEELELNGKKYRLKGFIRQYGELSGGHYVWYGCETNRAGKQVWRLADDAKKNPPLTDKQVQEAIKNGYVAYYVKAEEEQE